MFLEANDYFLEGEYLLCHSAYSACRYIVQSFKKVSGQSHLPPRKEFFNTKLGSIRIKSEHCIIKRILDLIECATILHNLLLDIGDVFPDEWLEELDNGHYWTDNYEGSHDVIDD